MRNLFHIKAALAEPLLITQSKAEEIYNVVADMESEANISLPQTSSPMQPYKADNLLYVPIDGTLVHKFKYMNPTSGMTGYNSIEAIIENAAFDNSIKGIVLDIDSPGGQVAGCFALASRINELKRRKPIYAVVQDMACSAAYAVASCADKIFIPQTGAVGSVGVVTQHVDKSEKLKNEGYKVTYVYAGKGKVDGNSSEPLSKESASTMQQNVDKLYNIFVSTISKNRDLDESVIKDFGAKIFVGEEAVKAGFADKLVMNGNEAHELIMYEIKNMKKDIVNIEDNNAKDLAQAETDANDAPDFDIGAIKAEAIKQERDRISEIFNSEQAEGKFNLAKEIAFGTDLEPDAAIKLLEAGASENSYDSLDADMAAEEDINLSNEAGDNVVELNEDQRIAALADNMEA